MIRAHGKQFLQAYGPIPPQQHYVLECLAHCRTAMMGAHRWECDRCGHVEQAYNSCGNRHCTKCQAGQRAEWLAARETDLLPVEYFHVVFTLPSSLARVALQNPSVVYSILFTAAAETLQEVAADSRHLGAKIGLLAVLHTWGQNLHHHPHIHCIVPGGGLSADKSQWISCPPGFFLPVRVLSIVYRAKFLAKLRQAYREGSLEFHGSLSPLCKEAAFCDLLNQTYRSKWVVHAKPPFGGPQQVLKYLARYTHRVAISNNRLQSLSDGRVAFRWKNYAKGHRWRTMSITAVEFIRRLLLHVLPKRFVKIRYYGLLASCHRRKNLARCRQLLATTAVQETTGDDVQTNNDPNDSMVEECSGPERPCPRCRLGRMAMVEVIAPNRGQAVYADTS